MEQWLTWEFMGFVFGAMTINFLAAMAPGPDTVLVIRLALRHGWVQAVKSAVGIGLGIGVHMIVVLSGLTYVMVAMPVVLQIIGVLGGVYLCYLGIQVFRDTSGMNVNDFQENHTQISTSKMFSSKTAAKGLQSVPLLLGFFTNVLNPKAFVFFLGVMAPLIQANSTALESVSAMTLVTGAVCLAVAGWFFILSYGASRAAFVDILARYGIWVNRLTGVVFLAYAGVMFYNAFMA